MAYTTKLNHEKRTDTIRWTGRDTRGLFRWVAYGRTYEDIWLTTIRERVNHSDDEDAFRLNRMGKTLADFDDADGETDYEAYEDAIWSVNMTDEDYKELLISCKGNAYYQTFEYRSSDQEDWVGEDEAPVYRIAADADLDRWGNLAYPGLIITETELNRLVDEWHVLISDLMPDLDRIN